MIRTVDENRWIAVDRYFEELFLPEVPALNEAIQASIEAGMPQIQVSATQGKMLHMFARAMGAKRILEVGTLAGYSTIWLARALPSSGHMVTLELLPKHAEVARNNLVRASVAVSVEIRVGPAAESLRKMRGQEAPFDFVFLDADKPGYSEYLDLILPLTRPGTVIIADNVVREGNVIDAESTDPNVQGIRRFLAHLATRPEVVTTALQTVGSKKYDGFTLSMVL